MNVDWNFIRKLEGWVPYGYVPRDRDKNDKVPSGVTIAAGFDIGQHSINQIKALKLSKPLEAKILPYAGLVGLNASKLLATLPLKLSKTELEELDTKVKQKHYEAVKKEFEDNSDLTFVMLDEAKQTVICSVAFQYGSLKRKCPKFFKYVTRGMWRCAVAELNNFGDGYPKRRKMEAKLLQSSIIPKKGN